MSAHTAVNTFHDVYNGVRKATQEANALIESDGKMWDLMSTSRESAQRAAREAQARLKVLRDALTKTLKQMDTHDKLVQQAIQKRSRS